MNFLSNLFNRAPRPTPRSDAFRPTLRVEALEDRRLMATYAGSLGSYIGQNIQSGRTVGYSDVGTIVQVSQSAGNEITAEIFNSSTCQQIRVVGVPGTGANDYEPTIAVANNGRFVVAWSDAYNGNYNDLDVRAQVFDANGNAVGGTIWVAATTHNENTPSVGMDANGNFVVAYTYSYSSTDHDIYANQYNASGGFLRTVYVATSTHEEYEASVDMNATGTFVVAYTYDYSSTDQDIYASSFNSAGGLLTHVLIAGSSQVEDDAAAAIDGFGNYVVAYTIGSGTTQVQAQRVSNAGYLVGAPLTVDWGSNSEYQASVDMASDGRFVVAYTYQYSSTDSDVYAQEFSASGAKVGGVFAVASSDYAEMQPSVAMNSSGNFAVGYGYFGPYNIQYQAGSEYYF
jgi:hypothetical protein